jgi:hypothetical protein
MTGPTTPDPVGPPPPPPKPQVPVPSYRRGVVAVPAADSRPPAPRGYVGPIYSYDSAFTVRVVGR